MPANDPTGRRFGEVAAAYERGRPEYPVGRVETVVAVEPDPGVRRVLSELLPGTPLLAGTGEDIPLRDGHADAVVAAQSWHWVDPVRAVLEAAYRPTVGVPSGPIATAELAWTHHVPVAAVIDMITSRSYVIVLPHERRAELVERLRVLADENTNRVTGLVPVPYVTRGYRAMRPRRRGGADDRSRLRCHPRLRRRARRQ